MEKNGNATIKRKEYLTYALGSFGYASITGYVSSYYNYFLTNCMLIGPAAIGTLMLVARIWDGINDPIEGVIIDKTKTRFGKLRPYILVSILPLTALTVLMFTVPSFGSTGKLIYTYIVYSADQGKAVLSEPADNKKAAARGRSRRRRLPLRIRRGFQRAAPRQGWYVLAGREASGARARRPDLRQGAQGGGSRFRRKGGIPAGVSRGRGVRGGAVPHPHPERGGGRNLLPRSRIG